MTSLRYGSPCPGVTQYSHDADAGDLDADRCNLSKRRQRFTFKPQLCKVNLMPSIEDESFPLQPLSSPPPLAVSLDKHLILPMVQMQPIQHQYISVDAVSSSPFITSNADNNTEEQNSHRIVSQCVVLRNIYIIYSYFNYKNNIIFKSKLIYNGSSTLHL